MSNDELVSLPIFELSKKIQSKEISVKEIVQSTLEQIEKLNPEINAFITVCYEEAIESAVILDKEIENSSYRGSLHGIPIGIKDIIDCEGIKTTFGSSMYRDNISKEDAECTRRLKEAGAVIIGKCNTHEFAMGSTNKNPHYGPCRNPWDVKRVPAGSSGGSGASVAAHMCPGTLGTDTGGSVRGPAAICGTIGLKPTYGLISLRGVHPNATSLDHVGTLTRNAKDSAIMLQSIAGYDPKDSSSVNISIPNYMHEIENGINGFRLIHCPDLIQTEIDSEIIESFENSLKILKDMGAKIETINCPIAQDINKYRKPIADAELLSVHRENMEKSPEKFGEDVLERLENAKYASIDLYIDACKKKTIIRRKMEEFLQGFDAIILPGYPCVAAPIETTMAEVNGKKVPFMGLSRDLTGPYNFVGFPAISVPSGFSKKEKLPMAIQIVGMPYNEAHILRIANAYESVTPEIRNIKPAL
tara:strand:+ start:345 stop:1763 length:1419 start_codon:yes stop_codon:yes gene_type:complete